jgi:hypothetical protein
MMKKFSLSSFSVPQLWSRLACYMYTPIATGSHEYGSPQLGMVASANVEHAHWPAATQNAAARLKIDLRPKPKQD